MIPTLLFAIAPSNCEKSFLGLRPWYHYLPGGDFDGCNIRTFHFLGSGNGTGDLPLVLLAVIDDLLRIVGLVTVGFVLYGAIQYIASQGNPEQTAKAQSTIINALIGMAVAVTSIAFVSFIGDKLGGTPSNAPCSGGGICSGSLPQVGVSNNPVAIVINIVLGIAGALALLMIVVSGLRYITSAGNPEKTSKAKNGIVYAMVGLVIAISADALVNFVLNRL